MKNLIRRFAAGLLFTTCLPAQRLWRLESLEGSSRPIGVQGIATDATGAYVVRLNDRSFDLQKLDKTGKQLWTVQSGEAAWITTSVTATYGSVYVAGVVNGEAPGQAGAGHFDIYVARYDSDGKQLWLRQFGTPDDDEGAAIAADPTGIYITSGTWIFARQNYSGSLRKFSPSGDMLWVRDLTGLTYFWIPVATDGYGVYLGANGPSSVPFLRKYSADGREEWTRQFAAQRPGISGIAADGGGVYAALDDYSGNQFSMRKLGPEGSDVWTGPPAILDGPGLPWRAMATDGAAVYAGASVRSALPGQCYSGEEDAVVRKYDSVTGEEIWSREFGTGQPDPVAGMSITGGEALVLAGNHLARLADNMAPDGAPRILNECVLNAASNIGGGVVSGEIVTIVVSGVASRVFFDGAPAPVLAAVDNRIITVVPEAVASRRMVDVHIEAKGVLSEAVTLPVLTERLGVFSADGSGKGQAAIVNEDGTVNSASNPAQPGSVISIYGTGGRSDAIAIAISNEMKAYPEVDGGAEDYRYYGQILYAGVVEGLLQVNIRLPAGVPAGNAVALHIRSGGAPIEQSLTMAIGR